MIWHGPAGMGDFHGVDAFKYELLRPFYKAFPDYHAKNDIEVANEEWVSATGFVTATHRGEWLGLPATGKRMRMRFSDFWLVRNGRLVENWVMIDEIDVMRQLGVDLLKKIR
jgi:predicted ester cyclase